MYVVFMTQLMSPAEMPSPLPSTRVSSIPSPWPKKRLRLSRISRSPLSNEGFGTPPPLAFSPYGTRPRTLRPSPRFTAGSSALRCSPDCTCFALSSSRPRWPIFLATSGAKSIFALERSTGTSRSLGSPGGCGMLNAKSLSLFSVLKASMLASFSPDVHSFVALAFFGCLLLLLIVNGYAQAMLKRARERERERERILSLRQTGRGWERTKAIRSWSQRSCAKQNGDLERQAVFALR
mmetsp:Transcript_228/g.853  ORF Transcript_228/g.853 Transcript_228/m.853 type:complete len:237 (-) Transcript_228:116-826(-)